MILLNVHFLDSWLDLFNRYYVLIFLGYGHENNARTHNVINSNQFSVHERNIGAFKKKCPDGYLAKKLKKYCVRFSLLEEIVTQLFFDLNLHKKESVHRIMGTCKLFWLLGIVLAVLEATKAGGEVGRQFRYRSCSYPVDKQSFLSGLLNIFLNGVIPLRTLLWNNVVHQDKHMNGTIDSGLQLILHQLQNGLKLTTLFLFA